MKRFFLTLCSVLLLNGCASNPSSSLSYYLLDSSGGDLTNTTSLAMPSKPLVLLGRVELSEFLQQSSLVMRLDDHQLHHAHNHIWSEPLSDSVPKALLKDLRHYDQRYHFERGGNEWFGKERYRIKIQIDQFYPTAQQQVLMTGRYWLESSENGEILAQDFQFTQALTQDGYGHSVARMRGLLTDLAQQIVTTLK